MPLPTALHCLSIKISSRKSRQKRNGSPNYLLRWYCLFFSSADSTGAHTVLFIASNRPLNEYNWVSLLHAICCYHKSTDSVMFSINNDITSVRKYINSMRRRGIPPWLSTCTNGWNQAWEQGYIHSTHTYLTPTICLFTNCLINSNCVHSKYFLGIFWLPAKNIKMLIIDSPGDPPYPQKCLDRNWIR